MILSYALREPSVPYWLAQINAESRNLLMNAENGWELGLAQAIQHLRVDRRITRKELAERAGISYPFLSEIEKGTKQPSSKKLGQLARALDLEPENLVEWARQFSQEPGPGDPELSRMLADLPTSRLGPPQAGDQPPPTSQAIPDAGDHELLQEEIRALVASLVDDTLRIWSRDVLPLLVERELARITADQHEK